MGLVGVSGGGQIHLKKFKKKHAVKIHFKQFSAI